MAYNFSQLQQRVEQVEVWLKKEYGSLRTGRATPTILDVVHVDSYGTKMPINQLASVTTEDARSLRIAPWDQSQVKSIEKAIIDASLGLSVQTDDKGLRVVFPELTQETRQALLKVAKQKLEEARISLRKEREEVWEDIQNKEEKGELSEDDKFRLKEQMQKIVDTANKTLGEISEKKEKEITG